MKQTEIFPLYTTTADELRTKYLETREAAKELPDSISSTVNGRSYPSPNPAKVDALIKTDEAYYDWVEQDADEMQRVITECIASIGPLDETTKRKLLLQKRRQLIEHEAITAAIVTATTPTKE